MYIDQGQEIKDAVITLEDYVNTKTNPQNYDIDRHLVIREGDGTFLCHLYAFYDINLHKYYHKVPKRLKNQLIAEVSIADIGNKPTKVIRICSVGCFKDLHQQDDDTEENRESNSNMHFNMSFEVTQIKPANKDLDIDDASIEDEIDFIQPKKVVDKMISANVINDIKAEIESLSIKEPITDGINYCGVRPTDIKEYRRNILEIIEKYIREIKSNYEEV